MSGTYRCRNCKIAVDDTRINVSGPASGTIYGSGYAYVNGSDAIVFDYDGTDEEDTYIDEYESFRCDECGEEAKTLKELFTFVEADSMPDADGNEVREGDTILVVGDYHGEPQVEGMIGGTYVVQTLDAEDEDYPFEVLPELGVEVWLCSQDVRLHTAPVLNEKGKVVTGERIELGEAAKEAIRVLRADLATQALMDLGL